MWKCRVVHPFGLDPFSSDVRSLPGFYRSLEILTYLRSETSRLGMQCGEYTLFCFFHESRERLCHNFRGNLYSPSLSSSPSSVFFVRRRRL